MYRYSHCNKCIYKVIRKSLFFIHIEQYCIDPSCLYVVQHLILPADNPFAEYVFSFHITAVQENKPSQLNLIILVLLYDLYDMLRNIAGSDQQQQFLTRKLLLMPAKISLPKHSLRIKQNDRAYDKDCI